MGWAIRNWGFLEGKALREGILTLNGPTSLLDFPPRLFIAFVESVLREDEEMSDELDKIYKEYGPRPKIVRSENRLRDIMSAVSAFGG